MAAILVLITWREGDGRCAIYLGLQSSVTSDTISNKLLVMTAHSLLLECVMEFAPGGPQGGYESGLGLSLISPLS